jgi:type IV secretion system protein TrbB
MMINEEQRARLIVKLQRECGELMVQALKHPEIIEVMLNPDGNLWIDKFGDGMVKIGTLPSAQAETLISTTAAIMGTVVSHDAPILEGEFPLDGSRFEGIIAPVVLKPTFAIRKKAVKVFSLEAYRDRTILSYKDDPANRSIYKDGDVRDGAKDHYDILKNAVILRKNILVVGSTGSGKTTFVNAILDTIAKDTSDHRIVIIEDTAELQCTAENAVQLRSWEHVSMLRCLKATMRLRPDRIIVGETRGPEALALLKAWNTGHPGGLATVHANDAMAGLIRMEQLIQEANVPPQPELIAEAVNIVIFIGRDPTHPAGRKIKEMILVTGYDHEKKQYKTEFL